MRIAELRASSTPTYVNEILFLNLIGDGRNAALSATSRIHPRVRYRRRTGLLTTPPAAPISACSSLWSLSSLCTSTRCLASLHEVCVCRAEN